MNKDGLWKASGGLVGLVALLVMIVAANIIISNIRLRVDLTGEKLYTLSDGSKNIIKKLDSDVTLKLFVSSSAAEVPIFLKSYAKKVEDLLQEYRMISGGKISIEKYDPKPDSDEEEWAQRYGIQGQQTAMFGPPVYFGLVASCGKTEAMIPNLDPRMEELLEYNITRLIYRAVHPDKPVIGVLGSLPVLGAGQQQFMMPQQPRQQPWQTFQQLRDDYAVMQLPPTVDTIDSTLSALIIVHPKELPDQTLYAIDQFVLRGGRALVFVDPFCVAEMETAPAQQFRRPETSSNLEKLFSSWGVTFTRDKVIADMGSASRIRSQNNQIEDSPFWLTLRDKNISRKDIMTTQLNTMMMPFAGAFKVNASSNLTITPLITSTDAAGLMESIMAQMGPANVTRGFKKEPLPLNMAVRLTGKFTTAFPDGKPKDEAAAKDEKKEDKPAEKESSTSSIKEGNSTVILVGDVDMLYDRFCVEQGEVFGFKTMQPINDNLSFFANAVEQISGSSDMIGIRSRGRFQRPFERVLALEQNARTEWQSHEESLTEKLRQTQQQLESMQSTKDKSQRSILSADQKRAIAKFREEEIRIKNELKTVRKNLRRDIETLGMQVKTINIAMMPLIVVIAGVSYGIYRKKKR
ncbi:MAG: hypothetical protein A2283_21365 [Lentisphaerae bacterium RIFOXYA12_FULL_48_11]|nr:MAG: hypothetical protein A2283_21365 [Lentisphaerae bacterium RIFOXYA12_FULL_48_11]